jgi:ElaB/YqjD/DUF883 family membrane-anchored ribosome-binding protein
MANAQIVSISKDGTNDKPKTDEQRLPAEEEIRRMREQIAATTTQIQLHMRSNLSWKRWVDRYPLAIVTMAATTGLLIGFALPLSERPSVRSNSKVQGNLKREQKLIEETGKNTLVATVLTNVAMNILREGSNYLARRFFSDK